MNLLIGNRRELSDRYLGSCATAQDKLDVGRLWSPTCARLRDAAQFARTPFDVEQASVQKLRVANLELDWIDASAAGPLVRTVRLDDLGVKPMSYCGKRAAFLHSGCAEVADLLEDELAFISEFTSAIVWLGSDREDTNFGNSSFYLAPHITFMSDGSLFFISPMRQIPREYGAYGFIENLFHESLHHQVHAHCAFTQTNYCVPGIDAFRELLDFPCRTDRTFTLFQAINACHVYAAVTPLRMRVHAALVRRAGGHDDGQLDWLLHGARDSLQMWLEFSQALSMVGHKLLPVWRALVQEWADEAQSFSNRSPELRAQGRVPLAA